MANLARHLRVDPEAALRKANEKFRRRFNAVEDHFTDKGQKLADQTLEDLDAVWVEIKTKT